MHCITKSFYRAAFAVILVYDITNNQSLRNLDRWIQEIRKYGEQTATLVLLGNKWDLECERQITYEQGQKFAEKHSMMFFETSAKEGININEVFSQLAEVLKCKSDEQVIPWNFKDAIYLQNQTNRQNTMLSKCLI